MGCIQSKPSKRQGLFHQQEEIISRQGKDEEVIRQGNNNKDDSEKVKRSYMAISGPLTVSTAHFPFVVKLLLTNLLL